MSAAAAERIVVLGAGHSAGQLAARLRNGGFEGSVTLVGDEREPPYQRPPLSKGFLAGDVPLERVLLRPASFYEDAGIGLRLGTPAATIDRGAREVTLDGGERLAYDWLVLATGSRVRELPVPGADLTGVHYLRRIADSEGIRAYLRPGARLVVVGGGYIGLEVAAVASLKGADVTVLEMGPRLMGRVVGPQTADHLRHVHEDAGVRVVTGAAVSAIRGDGRVERVECADDTAHEADAVAIGVGIVPETRLAERAGLAVADGILVDDRGRTEDPRVYACGDCTRHPSAVYDRRVRLESVHNAMAQAAVVAANLCGGDRRYDEAPWFWSDQYDLKLQIAGLCDGYDETVLRGDPAAGGFSVFYRREGRLIAADTVNGMQDHIACRTLVARASGAGVHRLSDPDVSLKSLVEEAGG